MDRPQHELIDMISWGLRLEQKMEQWPSWSLPSHALHYGETLNAQPALDSPDALRDLGIFENRLRVMSGFDREDPIDDMFSDYICTCLIWSKPFKQDKITIQNSSDSRASCYRSSHMTDDDRLCSTQISSERFLRALEGGVCHGALPRSPVMRAFPKPSRARFPEAQSCALDSHSPARLSFRSPYVEF
jgi:hypothetical protein